MPERDSNLLALHTGGAWHGTTVDGTGRIGSPACGTRSMNLFNGWFTRCADCALSRNLEHELSEACRSLQDSFAQSLLYAKSNYS